MAESQPGLIFIPKTFSKLYIISLLGHITHWKWSPLLFDFSGNSVARRNWSWRRILLWPVPWIQASPESINSCYGSCHFLDATGSEWPSQPLRVVYWCRAFWDYRKWWSNDTETPPRPGQWPKLVPKHLWDIFWGHSKQLLSKTQVDPSRSIFDPVLTHIYLVNQLSQVTQ